MNDPEEDTVKVTAPEGEGDSQKQEVCSPLPREIDLIDWKASQGCPDLPKQVESKYHKSRRID